MKFVDDVMTIVAIAPGKRMDDNRQVRRSQISLPTSQKQSAKIAVEVSGTAISVCRTRIRKSPGKRPIPKRARRGSIAENTIDARTNTTSHLSIAGLYCTCL